MKTYHIEVQRIKSLSDSHGLVHARVDAMAVAAPGRDDSGEASSTLSLSVENARVLLLLLKNQLKEIDSRKARSQR